MNPATVIRGIPPMSRGSVVRGRPNAPVAQPAQPIATYSRPVVPQTYEPQPYPEQYQQVAAAPYYYPPAVIPGAYGHPYAFYAVPTYYQPMTAPGLQPQMMAYNFHNYVKPQKGFQYPPSPNRGHNTPLFVPPPSPHGDLVGVGGGYYPEYASEYGGHMGYATASVAAELENEPDEADVTAEENRARTVDVHMGATDLYNAIQTHFATNPQCRISWLNRLLAKTNSASEFQKAVKAYLLYQARLVQATPETGTLLIKAACRAGLPEQALEMLKDVYRIRIFPTLGGIHYLMINFSLRKDTKSVMECFEAAKLRQLQPNTRTYHILIRECVDNNLIEDANVFAAECEAQNIVPNRVTYNILMNGCRKSFKAEEILKIRDQMNKHNIETNDTTVKFTALAHMMLGNVDAAVKAFHEYPELKTKLEEFCGKFFELTEEDDATQKTCVVDLLNAVDKQTTLPASIKERIATVSAEISAEKKNPEAKESKEVKGDAAL